LEVFEARTNARSEMREITREVQAVLSRSRTKRGHVVVFSFHTTAGLTINENADPSVQADLLAALERLVPWEQSWYRHAEGNSAAHIKAGLMGASVTAPFENGRLALGQWQGIFLCEFDGPRTRRVGVRVVAEE
jgi:secondary thiamine-phosphate synthase enzyme